MTAPPPPPQRRYRRLFLAMPFFGIADVMGAPSDNYDPGLRLGTLLGFRVTEALSLNGEFMVDVLNPDLPSGVTRGELYLDLAFSPLVHVKTSETVELVFGPKLGGFGYGASGSGSFSASGSGWLLGVNAGLFVAVNPFMSFGGLINYVYRNSTRYCTTVAGQQMCDPSPDGEAHLLGFNVAALF
jgi:hypothetical protein